MFPALRTCTTLMYTVQSSLYCFLDLYAAIAILPTRDILESILESLKASNLRWDTTVKQGFATPVRPGFQPPTKAVRWQVLVLHPDAVCPEGAPIAILKNPSLEKVANPVWVNHSAVRFTLCDSVDQPRIFIHGDPGGECLIPVLPTTRLENESVSVIAAVINANAKLQHAISNNYPSATDTDILALADLCHKIVAEFFTHPRRSSPTRQSERGFEDEGVWPAGGDVCMDYLSTFTHTSSRDASNIDVVKSPEEPDEKGLTRSEYKQLMQKVGDPDLGAEEKVQVATMMLFGPRRMYLSLTRVMKRVTDSICSISSTGICHRGVGNPIVSQLLSTLFISKNCNVKKLVIVYS